jgi:hypothetical protein
MRHRKVVGVAVPGGFVTTAVRGGMPLIASLARNAALPLASVTEDIVVLDETKEREVYREGPYRSNRIGQPLQRIIVEIDRVGIEEFLRRRQIENSQLGPVNAPSGNFLHPLARYFAAWFDTLIHRKRSG